ncbi:MAG: glycosyltransferase family 2 protein [Flavobacteriales bacterium]|nr:glycosyltransferase family 2 protein [Flavobacteriales bacterium]
MPLISVIMPAYNAARFISEAIASVMDQTWTNWELIVVNDGSTDGTSTILDRMTDPRIRVLHQENQGVSRARNAALEIMRGEYVAFLDADDVLPPSSLRARLDVLRESPSVGFADGAVWALDDTTRELAPLYVPTFSGPPFNELMCLSATCFFGPTWMIRRSIIGDRRFPPHMKHAEDLAFYLSICRDATYAHTDEPVLHYRRGHGSAMSDLQGLDRGYQALFRHASALVPAPTDHQLRTMWARIQRMMFRGFLKRGALLSAVRVLLRSRPT